MTSAAVFSAAGLIFDGVQQCQTIKCLKYMNQIEPLTEQVKRFTLVATDGKPLPTFTGGSHVIVQMSDGDNEYSNAYSLLSSPHDTSCYQIAVRLEEHSRGGSRFTSAGKSGRSVNDFNA